MARRPFILVAGQSNATPVADAQSWEDEHLTIALRSPRNPVSSAQQFSRASGTSSDKITLPITFAGGPQQGQFGDGDPRGVWQIADCQGKAIQALRLLTFYNPTASYLNLGIATTQTFPGVGEIGFFSTGRIINGSVRWHYNVDTKLITRLRTGTVHEINKAIAVASVDAGTDEVTTSVDHYLVTGDVIHFTGATVPVNLIADATYYAIRQTGTKIRVATSEANATKGIGIDLGVTTPACSVHLGPAVASATISVTPPFVPPPEVGEQYSYPIYDVGGSTTTRLKVNPAFGGIHDLGSTQDAPPYAAVAGAHYAKLRRVYSAAQTSGPARMSIKARPVTPGQVFALGTAGLGGLLTSVDTAENVIVATSPIALGYFRHQLGDGTPIKFTDLGGGVLPSPLTFGTTYYIRNSALNNGVDSFQVSADLDGAIINLGAGFAGTIAIETTTSSQYYVTRVVDNEESVTGGAPIFSPDNYILFGSVHGLTEGERVRLTATTFPDAGLDPQLNATTDYYVREYREKATISSIDLGANEITTSTPVNFATDEPIQFVTTATMPTYTGGTLSASTYYFAEPVSASVFKVRLTAGGAAIDLTGAGSGTITVMKMVSPTRVQLSLTPPGLFLTFDATAAVNAGTETITIASHGMVNGTKVILVGAVPGGLVANTNYYVVGATTNTFQLSATFGGSAINISTAVGIATVLDGDPYDFGANGTSITVTRKDWYSHFFFSLQPGGTEVELVGNSGAQCVAYIQQSFRGSLTGLVITCTSGANAGQQVGLADIELADVPLRAVLLLASAFQNTPTAGDTYLIHPPAHNGEDVPFDKFALWLPWSPFEGHAYQYGPVAATVAEVDPVLAPPGNCFIDTNGGALLSVGDVVRIYSNGRLPSAFEPGRRYYVTEVGLGGASAFLSTTYGGPNITGTVSDNGTGTHVVTVERQRGRTNPFPPGFNYPNHLQIIGSYQPFDGQALLGPPKAVFYTGLGIRLAEYLGEPVYVAACAIGGTGIGHRELTTAAGVSYGALDLSQQMSWDPGEPNGCFARMLATLDAAQIAFERQGDEGECIGVWWVQGEEDATYEDQANRYYENATRLRDAMRQAIKDRNLTSGPADRIRWIQPLPQTTFGQYYDTVRAAITKMVDEDPYSATHELTDLERMDVILDPYHYSGSGMTEFERRSYEAWLGLQRNSSDDVALCNLALSYIGNKATVTSIDPPDGSAEAALCASFFDLALRSVLRMHPWTFATEKAALVAVNTGDADNDDSAYAYRYKLPLDCVHPIAVVHAEATNDTVVSGVKVPADFVVKRSTADKAQRLYTNQEDAYLRYVAYEPDSAQWDPLFKIVFTWHLASMLAGAIIKTQEGDQAAQRCLNRMAQYLAEAKKADFQERQVTLSEKSKFTRAR